MPAMPASRPDSANANSMTRSTRMPMSRAASRFCTTASNALPWRDVENNTCRPAASNKPMIGISACRYWILMPATVMCQSSARRAACRAGPCRK